MSELTREDIGRFLVRSMDRLKDLARAHPPESNSLEERQLTAWIDWHDRLVAEAQAVGILPKLVLTRRTELGRKHGAI